MDWELKGVSFESLFKQIPSFSWKLYIKILIKDFEGQENSTNIKYTKRKKIAFIIWSWGEGHKKIKKKNNNKKNVFFCLITTLKPLFSIAVQESCRSVADNEVGRIRQ